jgi:hypothetical protein
VESLSISPLLRSGLERIQEARQGGQDRLYGGMFRVLAGDGETGLATLLGLGGHAM